MQSIRAIVATLALFAAGFAQAADDAVFVSAAAGSDAANGLSPRTPVRSIAAGIQRAAANGRRRVLVAGGNYDAFVMANGIDVIGGYGQDFESDAVATGGSVAEVRGAFMPALGYAAAVLAQGITQPTRVSGFTLQQSAALPERSSIGLAIRNGSSGLVVENLRIVGATLPAGAAGAPGSDASQVPATAGAAGAAAATMGYCNDSARRSGGAGGQNATAGSDSSGAAGGLGGTQSTDCRRLIPDLDPTAGLAGAAAREATGGAGGPANSTTAGQAGGAPLVTVLLDGLNGARGYGQLMLVNGIPTRARGAAGSLGRNGSGGGGGGGGGGIHIYAAGAGGGGGGAGGAHAPSAGMPGQPGGNSIGIFVVNSNPTIRNCGIARGFAGAGGAGGAGGRGQPGGAGGAGGTGLSPPYATGLRGAGGSGGSGGRGGHSGAGAGGAGGHSIGILRDASSAPSVSLVSYTGGAGGAGGAAGKSHAGAGQAGPAGQVYGLLAL